MTITPRPTKAPKTKRASALKKLAARRASAARPTPNPAKLRTAVLDEMQQTNAAMEELLDYTCYLTQVLTGKTEMFNPDDAPYKPARGWAQKRPAARIIGAEPDKTPPETVPDPRPQLAPCQEPPDLT